MLRLAHALAAVGTLTLLALGGCNAALGIDEAHLRDDGSSQSTTQVIPNAECDAPHTSCGTCASNSMAFTTCMADHNCRKALNEYRECLGSKCNNAACFDALSKGPAQTVADVVSAECPECQGNSPLASMCDLYCACMEQGLPASTGLAGLTCESFNGVPPLTWSVGDKAGCKDACKNMN